MATDPFTGAHTLVKSLEAAGVTDMFGIPGGAILPVYDPLMDSSVRHILVRHEQGAGHAAQGYAVATGRVGVCMATSGPGATNLVTPLADAHMDSVPIVAITGQVSSSLIGSDAFQEADIRGMTMPITKHNYLVEDADQIPETIAEAFYIASTGRPGPVLVDITKSALQSATAFAWPSALSIPGYKPTTTPDRRRIAEAADLIRQAKRPVFYIGGGVVRADAADQLLRLVEVTGIPAVTTLMARGALSSRHPLNLGMPGMHGTVAAVTALQKADLLITLGARFDNRVTGAAKTFAPEAKTIHIDIDPAEIGKIRPVEVPIVGDCRAAIVDLITNLTKPNAPALESAATRLGPWRTLLRGIESAYPLGYTPPADGSLAPQLVIERLAELVGPKAVYTAGVGQHQMWASHYLHHANPKNWINSGGLGTMGFSVPAAMGAKVGRPDDTVWAIDGDGCFQMTGREMATCSINNIPIKVALINNSSLGMVRQLQSLYYNDRVSNVDLRHPTAGRRVPDFPKLAEAYGCVGLACDSPDDVDAVIEKAMGIDDVPVLVDFRVPAEEMVWPAIADGASNNSIQLARGVRPTFDPDDV